MSTNLENFKKRMNPAKELYACEIRDFSKQFEVLGEMTMDEFPDIDTQEYIFEFEKLDGTSENELDDIHSKLYNHMQKFAKNQEIEYFCQWASIWL